MSGRGVLEIKTISGYNADKWEGGIPPYYIAQIQLYMLVLGYDYGQFAFLKDGRHMDVLLLRLIRIYKKLYLLKVRSFTIASRKQEV